MEGFHLSLKKKQPNKITQQAMKELDERKGHKVNSTSSLFNELLVKLIYKTNDFELQLARLGTHSDLF